MSQSQILAEAVLAVEVNEDFTEAVLRLRDQTRLCFCHRVGERWAKSVGPEGQEHQGGQAETLLSLIRMFRLNRKHLDIQFADGSQWDEALQNYTPGESP